MPRDEASDSGLKPALRGSIRGCGRAVRKSGFKIRKLRRAEQSENKRRTNEERNRNKSGTKPQGERERERERGREREREREVERENDSSPLKAPFRSDGDELQIQAFTCFFSL